MGQTCESKSNKIAAKKNNEYIVLDQCRATRDKLEKYIQNLELKEKMTKEKVKECLRKKQRDRAKFYLKGCKAYQQRIKIAEGKLSMIEDQIMNIENAHNHKDAIMALQQGNMALKQIQKEVTIEDLENVKEQMDELKDNDREIGDFLKEKLEEDEAGCEDELEQLVKEVQDEKNNNKNVNQNNNNNNIKLPNVPNSNINTGVVNNNNKIMIKE
jgi:hypothetical protein